MPKIVSMQEVIDLIPDGATIMVGGFGGCGSPHKIIDALSKSDKGGFTIITNDTSLAIGPQGEEWYGNSKLIHSRKIKRVIGTHVGTNPETGEQIKEGFIEVDLIPQGSFCEMIRAGGAGLGAVITPTGLGTVIETNENICYGRETINGKDYLRMKPLRADVALLSGYNVDKNGNIWYKGTTRNFNPQMATAADIVIVEADNVVELGAIEPENVHTPGVYINYIVDGGKE